MKEAIIVMGKPGSGKSTIAKELAERLGVHYTSTGDLARGLIAGEWQKLGLMAPESAMREAFEEDIREHDVVVVDGMPRKPEQVPYIDTLFGKVSYYIISITDEEVIKRLTMRGRNDDTPIAIRQRLKDYKDITELAIKRAERQHKVMIFPWWIDVVSSGAVDFIQKDLRGGRDSWE